MSSKLKGRQIEEGQTTKQTYSAAVQTGLASLHGFRRTAARRGIGFRGDGTRKIVIGRAIIAATRRATLVGIGLAAVGRSSLRKACPARTIKAPNSVYTDTIATTNAL